ncbi:T9SS type A sorting domain-containing protein [Flavivirga rizhaonensis]|uniref:T9SS type A sorting domain-containing protein n=1 Tax=Flavivirga rizhaonensis TaxID=2559571 RepID=A0A4V3P4J1_9FLAO|nr:T9SS type A sorting domain-containing protein [Flavivirga rizhaonensis]TGV01624.1 T9SS type A sorting domain-containing protein [Flavivirga rizhaonensis]
MKKKLTYILFLLLYTGSFAQVTLLFPENNAELTDIAVSFKVKSTTDGPYELQVSKDPTFATGVIKQEQTIKYRHRNFVYFHTRLGKNVPELKFLLDAGTWYWRVTDDGSTTFSETRTIIVNDDKFSTPVQTVISPEKPFFHFRIGNSRRVLNSPDPAALLKQMVPDHLKEYVIIDIGQSFDINTQGEDLLEYSRLFDNLGYKFLFDIGGTSDGLIDKGRVTILAELEQVFKELPNCVGAATSERFYGYFYLEQHRSQLEGALELCRKYGKVFSYGDMNHKVAKWQLFAYENFDLYKSINYGDYLLAQYKTTDPWGAYTNVSTLQGMKLSGMIKNIGIWSDAWCWEKFGQVNEFELADWVLGGHALGSKTKYHAYMQNIKQFIYGITYGSTVFTIEQDEQYDKFTGMPTDHYYRYLEPFLDFVIGEKLIPSEDAIKNNFKVIVDTEINSGKLDSTLPKLTYLPGNIWGDFLRSTYGITTLAPYTETISNNQGFSLQQSAYLEMIPNTDRYPSGIPFLPRSSEPAPIINGQSLDVVKISDLDTQAKANANLNIHYPASTNEAYARIIDKSIFVFNTLENHDVKQSYSLDINHAGIETMSGDIDLMSYIIGKIKPDAGDSVLFQVNAYVPNSQVKRGGAYALPAYPSILKFKCTSRPNIRCDEIEAIERYEWDATKKELTIEINHTVSGAVNFTLQKDPATETMKLGAIEDLVFTSTSLDFDVVYQISNSRDFIVSLYKPDGSLLTSTKKTLVPGLGTETFTLTTNPAPEKGVNYKVTAVLRPVGGDASQNLLKDDFFFELIDEAICSTIGVYNECFENGIGLWTGGFGAAVKEVQRNHAYQSNYSLMVKGNGSASAKITGLYPNTKYELKAFAKNLGTDNINFGVKDGGFTAVSVGVRNTTFEEKTLNFTTGATDTSVVVYFFSPNNNSEGYLDDISLEDKGCVTPNCDDLDQDGVLNKDDKCPNTPAGTVVDQEGCPVFTLAFDNFSIKVTGETCAIKNNGSIEITAKETFNYTAVLSGNGVSESKGFTGIVSFNNLATGSYELYIQVNDEPDYESTYYLIEISEPEDLKVTSKVSSSGKSVSLALEGGVRYNIILNDVIYKTNQSEVTFPLSASENRLVIKTDKDCQGIYEENIIIGSGSRMKIYPNPVGKGDVTIKIGDRLVENIDLEIYTMSGRQLKNKNYRVNNGKVTFNSDNIAPGIYLIKLKTATASFNYKVIKR